MILFLIKFLWTLLILIQKPTLTPDISPLCPQEEDGQQEEEVADQQLQPMGQSQRSRGGGGRWGALWDPGEPGSYKPPVIRLLPLPVRPLPPALLHLLVFWSSGKVDQWGAVPGVGSSHHSSGDSTVPAGVGGDHALLAGFRFYCEALVPLPLLTNIWLLIGPNHLTWPTPDQLDVTSFNVFKTVTVSLILFYYVPRNSNLKKIY